MTNSVPSPDRPAHALYHLLTSRASMFLRAGHLGETPKLIRDGVQLTGDVWNIEAKDARPLAAEKMFEELGELIAADAPVDVAEEAGDLIEAIYLWSRLHGVQPIDVDRARLRKARITGAFNQLSVWEG